MDEFCFESVKNKQKSSLQKFSREKEPIKNLPLWAYLWRDDSIFQYSHENWNHSHHVAQHEHTSWIDLREQKVTDKEIFQGAKCRKKTEEKNKEKIFGKMEV